MPKACDMRKGAVVKIKGAPHIVESLQISTPSARGAPSLYHFRFRNLVTRNKLDQVCKGDVLFEDTDLERRLVQYLYREGDLFTFMDDDTFDQFTLSKDALESQLPYLVDEMDGIFALVADGEVVAIELPQKVELTIASCDPVLKGASATGRGKPATCATGAVVMVPEYIESGEAIIVDTETGEFVSRAAVSKF